MNRAFLLLCFAFFPACLFDCDEEPPIYDQIDVSTSDAASDASTPDVGGDAGSDTGGGPDSGCAIQDPASVVVTQANDDLSDDACDCDCTFRDALNHVAADGTVGFDVDDLTVNEPLAIATSGITIDGGMGGTRLQAVDGASWSQALLRIEEGTGNVAINDLTFLADGAVALSIDGVDNRLENLGVFDATIGVLLRGTGVSLRRSSIGDGPDAPAAPAENVIGVVVAGSADGVWLEDNVIANSRVHGVWVQYGIGSVSIADNRIGHASIGNGGAGILLRRASATIEGNTISGNDLHGIFVDIPSSPPQTDTIIRGNRIGTDPSGTMASPNGLGGIEVLKAGAIMIGGFNSRDGCDAPVGPVDPANFSCNLITGNSYGVHIQSAQLASVAGNFIGVSADGVSRVVDGQNAPVGNGAGIVVGLYADTPVETAPGDVVGQGFLRRGIGGACAHAGDCLNGVDVDNDGADEQYDCVPEVFSLDDRAVQYPGGMCTASCSATDPCAEGLCVGAHCFAGCSSDSDCRRGYTCFDGACRFSPGSTPPAGEPAMPEVVGALRIGRVIATPPTEPFTDCGSGCNVIAGNSGDAVSVVDRGNTLIGGNFIGLGLDDAVALGNGSTPAQHNGIAIHHAGSGTPGNPALVGGNVLGANSGDAIVVASPTQVAGNSIGLGAQGIAPRQNRSGIVVLGALSSRSVVQDNLIANVSDDGIRVSGAPDVTVRTNRIGKNGAGATVPGSSNVGIRVVGVGATGTTVASNDIYAANSAGIVLGVEPGLAGTLVQMSETVVSSNRIEDGCETAALLVSACTNCRLESNTVFAPMGPGAVFGASNFDADFASTMITDNQFLDVGINSTDFISGVHWRSGRGADFRANTIDFAGDHGLVLGEHRTTDVDLTGTVFQSNIISDSQSDGVHVIAGFGGVLSQNTIRSPGYAGIAFAESAASFATLGFPDNSIDESSSASVVFRGAGGVDDGLSDIDNGANTLLNPPSLLTFTQSAPNRYFVGGTTNFAGARVDIYASNDNIDNDLVSLLGSCSSDPRNQPNMPEPFDCAINGNLSGQVLQATVSGRHFVIRTNGNPIAVGDSVAITTGSTAFVYSPTAATNPAGFTADLAAWLRTTAPTLLASASASCSDGQPCVHVVTGIPDSGFNATGPMLRPTQNRGIVTSATMDSVAYVP